MEAVLPLPEKPGGSYIFACFLEKMGLKQPCLLSVCPLDVPLQQILSLLANFNHI